MDPQLQHGVDSDEKKATIQYILHGMRIKYRTRATDLFRKTCETGY